MIYPISEAYVYIHIYICRTVHCFQCDSDFKKCYLHFYDREIISAFYDIKMSRGFVCLNVFHLVQMKLCNIMEDLLRAQPYRQSHEGGIVDLLFLGPYFKIITVDVVMLLRQGISGPKLGPSNFSIHKETVFTLYFCLNTLMSYQWHHGTTNLYTIPINGTVIFLNRTILLQAIWIRMRPKKHHHLQQIDVFLLC